MAGPRALLRLIANDAAEEFPRHEVQGHAHELVIGGLLGGLEGGLEVLFGADDGGALGGGGEEELDGCQEGFIGRGAGESERVEGGEEGGDLVMRGVCGGSDDEEGVQG